MSNELRQTPSKIFLVGPMGAGKTSVGRRLAQLLSLQFIDADEEIENRTGVDIDFIFEKEGEEGFRERERKIIEELTQLNNIVLATGGGAVLKEENRRNLSNRGFVIFLDTSIESQLSRTKHDNRRPLLQTDDREGRLRSLTEKRHPLYTAVSNWTVNTDGQHSRQLAQHIAQHISEHY